MSATESGRGAYEPDERQLRIGQMLLILCVLIWGVNAVAFKVALKPSVLGAAGPGIDAATLNALRFLSVAPFMVAAVAWRRPDALKIDRADALRYALYGFIAIAFGETVMTAALGYTSVANMALLGPGTVSLFTAIWAAVLGEQRFSKIGMVGAAVALLGVGVVAGSGPAGFRLDTHSLIGDALAMGRSAIHGCYLIFLTRTLRERSAVAATVYNVVFGALWFVPFLIWRGPSISWGAIPREVWVALLWTVFPTTLFGYAAWNWTMRRVGAVATTNVMYLLPLTSAVSAWLILGEPLRSGQILGGAVIVAGIGLLRWDALHPTR